VRFSDLASFNICYASAQDDMFRQAHCARNVTRNAEQKASSVTLEITEYIINVKN
jgi:hypothetical protein